MNASVNRNKAFERVCTVTLIVFLALTPLLWNAISSTFAGSEKYSTAKHAASSTLTTVTYSTAEPAPLSRRKRTGTMQSGINVWDLDEHRAALLRNAKILWVSSDVAFNSRFENVYSLCNKYGFKIIGNLNYETLSYNNAFTLDDWARVVNQAKNTYPLIAVWEIWNEPTLTKYHLGYMDGSPQHYVDLLKIAYEILKAANPNYVVLGLGGSQLNCVLDLPFSESVFSLGGGAYMDAISIHAYPDDLNKGQTWDYYKTVWTKLLDQYNKFGKDLWLTETGLESNQLTEEDQANYLKNSYSFFEEQGIAAFVFFQLIDYWETDTQVAFWGLLRTDQTVKPSYVAYEDLLETR